MREDKPEESGDWKKKEWYEASKWENKKEGQIVINVNCGKGMKKNMIERCFISHDGMITVILRKDKIKVKRSGKNYLIVDDENKEMQTVVDLGNGERCLADCI